MWVPRARITLATVLVLVLVFMKRVHGIEVRAVLGLDEADLELPPPAEQQPCLCEEKNLCNPVGDQPLRDAEIYGFVMEREPEYLDWTRMTTIAWAEFIKHKVCLAHSHGVKLVASPGIYAAPPITGNHSHRVAWATNLLKTIQAYHLDGISFDHEDPAEVGSLHSQWYTELVATTRAVFHAANPAYQITVCVAWSPDNIDLRGYDYLGLAKASDALYVMDYDTQSWIFGPCMAAANAPYFGAKYGLMRYLDLGIPAQKLILGVPWYGYRYPCEEGTAPDARFCAIPEKPFRGINCSDAAGKEMNYPLIMDAYEQYHSTEIKWDHNQKTPYFNTVENGRVYQYHYDNAASLRLKYELARSYNLRGVGPYRFDMTDEKDFWEAFDAFTGPVNGRLQHLRVNSATELPLTDRQSLVEALSLPK